MEFVKKDNNTIVKINSLVELQESKLNDLKVEEIVIEPWNKNHDWLIIKPMNGKKWRSILKLNLNMPDSLFTQDDAIAYYEDIRNLIDGNKIKIRVLNKTLDLTHISLGFEREKEISTPTIYNSNIEQEYSELQKSILLNMEDHQEYYIEVEASNENKLIKEVEKFLHLGNRMKMFNITFPTNKELEYLIDEVVVGLVDSIFTPTYIQAHPDTSNEYFVKYLVIDNINKEQTVGYWEELNRLGYDVLIDVVGFNLAKSKSIMKTALSEKRCEFKGANTSEKDEHDEDADLLRDLSLQVRQSRDRICDVNFVIKIEAKTIDELEQKIETVKLDLKDTFTIRNGIGIQQDIDDFYSGVDVNEINHKTMSLDSFVYGAGFYASSYIEQYGYPYCTSPYLNNIFIFNRRLRKPNIGYTNYNAAFFGETGSGKSSTMKLFLLEDFRQGDTIIVVDFAKEYREVVKYLGGVYIECSDDRVAINPFDFIKKVSMVDGKEAMEIDKTGAIDYDRLFYFIELLTENELRHSRIQLVNALSSIIDECNACYPEETMCFDLINKYINEYQITGQDGSAEQEIILLIKYIVQNYPNFSHESKMNINNRVVCFNLQSIRDKKNLVAAWTYLIIRLTNELMNNNKFDGDEKDRLHHLQLLMNYAEEKNVDISREIDLGTSDLRMAGNDDVLKNKAIEDFIEMVEDKVQQYTSKVRLIIDECHNVLRKENKEIIQFLDLLSREGRKYNSSVYLGTQQLTLFNNKEILDIFYNIPFISFGHFKKASIEDIDNFAATSFTDTQKEWLTKTAPGQGIIVIGDTKYIQEIQLSKKLQQMFKGGS